jgi:hypothetical protein
VCTKMPSLYVAVYLARPPVRRLTKCASETATAFCAAALTSDFPYDAGDDPAFFSARRHNNPITWGVCRTDIRCDIEKDDAIVFFAAQTDQLNNVLCYRFVAALRVANKIRHTDLSNHGLFPQYLNLLIRPSGDGWEHHEPVPKQKHLDWLWRITCRSQVAPLALPPKETTYRDAFGKTHKEKHWEKAGNAHVPGTPLKINECDIPVANNYVIFSDYSPIVADNPPTVALYVPRMQCEHWSDDELSQRVRRLVLRDSSRYLRTSNPQQAHRHIHHHLTTSELEDTLRQLRSLVKSAGH